MYENGELVELDGSWCVRLLEEQPELKRFARAFVRSGEQRVIGIWRCDQETYALRIEAIRDEGEPSARLELTQTPRPYGLTVRELDVVTLMTGGLSTTRSGCASAQAAARSASTPNGFWRSSDRRRVRAQPRWPLRRG